MKKSIDNLLIDLSEAAKLFGLREVDFSTAIEFIEHREYGLCFDTVVTQIYEYDIQISAPFYRSVSEIAKELNVSEESYSFLKI